MIDYLNLTDKEEQGMSSIFSEWIKWFFRKANISADEIIYTDGNKKDYTVDDFTRIVTNVFGFQSACKEYLTAVYDRGGRDAAIDYMRGMMPLVSAFDKGVA